MCDLSHDLAYLHDAVGDGLRHARDSDRSLGRLGQIVACHLDRTASVLKQTAQKSIRCSFFIKLYTFFTIVVASWLNQSAQCMRLNILDTFEQNRSGIDHRRRLEVREPSDNFFKLDESFLSLFFKSNCIVFI